ERPHRPTSRAARARRAGVRPRAEAVVADDRRAGARGVLVHRRLRAVARRPHPRARRRRVRGVHRAGADRDGDGAGGVLQQLLVGLPGALGSLHQRRAVGADAPLGGQPRAGVRRHRARAGDRGVAARARPRRDRRAGAPPVRARARAGDPARAVRVAGRGRRRVRRDVGPARLRQQHRDPAAELPRRRLLLRRRAALAVAGDQPRQPDLLSHQRRALRISRDKRRAGGYSSRGDGGTGARLRRVERDDVPLRPSAEGV
ncbi:MAG: permease, partial [uncultured Solirubrobacteraceae bacterium]